MPEQNRPGVLQSIRNTFGYTYGATAANLPENEVQTTALGSATITGGATFTLGGASGYGFINPADWPGSEHLVLGENQLDTKRSPMDQYSRRVELSVDMKFSGHTKEPIGECAKHGKVSEAIISEDKTMHCYKCVIESLLTLDNRILPCS